MKLLFFLLFVIGSLNAFCQTKKDGYDCKRISNEIFAERLKHYPFSQAAAIKLISFESAAYTPEQPLLTLHLYLSPRTGKKTTDSIIQYLSSLHYVISPKYINTEAAIKNWNESNDTMWKQPLINNPLPASIEFEVEQPYLKKEKMERLYATLKTKFPETIIEFQYPNTALPDALNTKNYFTKIRAGGDSIMFPVLLGERLMTMQEIDSLTDILYSYGVTGGSYDINIISCYDPQNAIIFLDTKGNPFEFIEICFSCQKIRNSSKKVEADIACKQTLEMLQRIFISAGLN